MKRLIIADAHVGQREGDAVAMCQLLRTVAEAGFNEVVFLGDAFQYLIGMSKFWNQSVEQVLPVWRELRSRGIRIAMVEGNRDFFLTERELAPYLDFSARSYDFKAGTTHYRLVHGDRVNLDDHYYLFWCSLSKSSLARLWARLLPRRMAVAIVSYMEAKLARTNQEFRYKKPVAHLMREAEKAWAANVDVLLWGHFHTSWRYAACNRTAMVIPAWLENRVAAQIESDGQWCLVDESLNQVHLGPSVECDKPMDRQRVERSENS